MSYTEHDLNPRLLVTDAELKNKETKLGLITALVQTAQKALGKDVPIEVWLTKIGTRPGVRWFGVRKETIPLTLGQHPEVGAELIYRGRTGRK